MNEHSHISNLLVNPVIFHIDQAPFNRLLHEFFIKLISAIISIECDGFVLKYPFRQINENKITVLLKGRIVMCDGIHAG